jgi:Polyphosphate kinase 2 (PPK2)
MTPWRRGRDALLTPIVMVVGGGLAAPDPAETAMVSTDDQVLDVPTAVASSDLLEELPHLRVDSRDDDEPVLLGADGRPVETWRERYPYPQRLGRQDYERTKRRLQIELLKLQYWIKATDQRVIILFEGRDAAGKGGTIKRFTEHLNPRGARVVALDKPNERERGQWYFQRYLAHLPAAGELVMFDRSWYTRAGVERVMGFCSPAEYQRFMDQVPRVEAMRHVLDRFAYDDKDHDTVGTPDPRIVGSPADVYDEDRLGDHPGRHPEHGD